MFVVAKIAIAEIIKLPFVSNTFSSINDKGTFDEEISCHVAKLREDIATKTYTIVVIIIDNKIDLEIVFEGFFVSSAIFGIFSNP